MKRFGWTAIGLALLLSCSAGSGPKGVVKSFFSHLMEGNYEKAYLLVATQDKKFKSLEEFKGQNGVLTIPYIHRLKKAIRIREKSVRRGDDSHAVVQVQVRHPDYNVIAGALKGNVMGLAFSQAGSEQKAKEVEAAFHAYYEGKPIPLVKEQLILQLEKQGTAWKIRMPHWRVQSLMNEADQDARSGNYSSALKVYSRILQLEPGNEAAQAGADSMKEKEPRQSPRGAGV
ncbi:MAG: hypothetical protein P8Z49_08330 [Acidobacteriota bacterium]